MIQTLNGSSTPYGQATLNLDSVLGRGLKVGEYLQFTLNRQNDTGAIGLTAFGANHGSGSGAGSQTFNVFAAGAWNAISYNATGSGSVPTYTFVMNTTTLGVKFVAATGESATVNYYVNGVFTGSWLYQTTATTLDTISLFAQSSTTNAAFDFNNLTVYTTDGNLAATSYKWDPGHTNTGNGGGSGTWDAGSTANFYNASSSDVTWSYATLGDNVTFGGTAGNVTVASVGVTAGTAIFNTAGYTVSGGTITMMGNQTITNTTSWQCHHQQHDRRDIRREHYRHRFGDTGWRQYVRRRAVYRHWHYGYFYDRCQSGRRGTAGNPQQLHSRLQRHYQRRFD